MLITHPPSGSGTLTTTTDNDNDNNNINNNSTLTSHPHPTLTPPPTYKSFYTQFLHALSSAQQDDVPVKPTDAAVVIRLVELARKSSEEGRTVDV